jgi:hypothetical protein
MDLDEPLEQGCVAVPLSRPFIEAASDGVALRLRQRSQRGALRQVLTNQAIGVFVGAALPGVIRSREVELQPRLLFNLFVAVKLGSVVRRDGLE